MKRTFLTCLLSFLLVFGGPASLVVSAQSGGDPSAPKVRETETFVLYQDERGEIVCRVASPDEILGIIEDGKGRGTRVIYGGAPSPRSDSDGGADKFTANAITSSDGEPAQSLLPTAGLRIVLRGTAQLEQHPEAKQAFIVAANRWESLISTPITVVLEVDYGTQFFGQDYPSANILGQTGSASQISPLSAVRDSLAGSAAAVDEAVLYNALPSVSLPIEHGGTTGSVSNVRMTFPSARALGLRANITNPDTAPSDARIGFNSTTPTGAPRFDFNPEDGIDSDKTDFDAVTVHEIGHALGFTSSSGGETTPVNLSLWDVFRFRPGMAGLGTLATAPRVMSAGDDQVFFNNRMSTFGTQELALSTGGPNGNAPGGDNRQSSHWKDDALSGGVFIGIMDPNIPRGTRKQVTTNDLNALDTFGYTIGGTAPQPVRPANDDFDNSVELVGANGSVTGTNVAATKQPGEPNHASDPGGGSVWYRWTAPGTGQAVFNTEGSNYDTLLAVYTGASVGGLSFVTANDDVQNGVIRTSIVTFNATAGTTYRIAVDGWNGETGPLRLNWTAQSQSFTISGSAKDSQGNGIANATVVLSKEIPGGSPSSKFTDANGNFSYTADPGVNYTLSISKPGFVFNEPRSVTFNNLSANQTVNFTARRPILSGRVSGVGGNVAGATVTLAGPKPGTTTTDAEGRYSFNELPEGDYTVTPHKAGQFVPFPRVVNIQGDQTNFDLRLEAYIRVSGRVTDNDGNPMSGASIRLANLSTPLAVNADGSYAIGISPTAAAPITVVAEMPGYDFAPQGATFTSLSVGNQVLNFTGTPRNPIDGSQFFVAQHYRDFLGREADAGGLAFWTSGIETCGTNQQCRANKRIDTSAAFFLSIEFQETGFLVHKMYKAAYGEADSSAIINNVPTPIKVPVVRMEEFFPDSQRIGQDVIVGTPGWPQRLAANKEAFALEFVQRARFTTAFPSTMTPTAFVQKLNTNAGNVLDAGEQQALVNELNGNNTAAGRASVLRKVAEDADLGAIEKNKAFVLMQYFGYMRRNPNGFPDTDHSGYNFWLQKLNDNGGDYHRAQMVLAFLDSFEYRDRFGR